MKKILQFACCCLLILPVKRVTAQCHFTATITPSNPILCPGGTDTLSTQVYDHYQWYRNGHLIEGATHRTYGVSENDIGYAFKVAVTKNGCTDTSKRVIVDGYVFLLPYIIETGDVGVYDPKKGALIECPDDTLILTLGDPYNVHVQWYDNFKPIPGATEQTYYVTHTGSYTACGAPEVCPHYFDCEGLPINAFFENPTAHIKRSHDTLFASNAKQYQWFLFNRKIPGATTQYYVPKVRGSYTVATIDKYKCPAVSDPYHFVPNGLSDVITVSPNPVNDVLHVHTKLADARQIILSDMYGNRMLQATLTSSDQNIPVREIQPGTYLLQLLNSQNQVMGSMMIIKQ